VKTFLNRLLGLPVGFQNKIFTHFAAEVEEKIKLAKKNNEYDDAVVDIRGANVQLVGAPVSIHEDALSKAKTTHIKVKTDRGISFDAACAMLDKSTAENGGSKHRGDGFYKSKNRAIGLQEHHFILALHRNLTASEAAYTKPNKQVYRVYRPSTGPARPSMLSEIKDVYVEVTREEAEAGWSQQYASALRNCMHGPNCRTGTLCTIGRRERIAHVLSGSLLPVWSVVERIVRGGRDKFMLKVTRVRTDDGARVVGVVVPAEETVRRIVAELAREQAGTSAGGPSGLSAGARFSNVDIKPTVDVKPVVPRHLHGHGHKRDRPSSAKMPAHARPVSAPAPTIDLT